MMGFKNLGSHCKCLIVNNRPTTYFEPFSMFHDAELVTFLRFISTLVQHGLISARFILVVLVLKL